MTRTAVDNTISRLKAWVRMAMYPAGIYDALDDLEDLRRHDEAQAAELELLRTAALAHDAEIDCAMAEVERLRAALVAAADDLQRDADKLLEPAGGLDYEHQAPAVQEAIDALDKRATVLRAAAEGKS